MFKVCAFINIHHIKMSVYVFSPSPFVFVYPFYLSYLTAPVRGKFYKFLCSIVAISSLWFTATLPGICINFFSNSSYSITYSYSAAQVDGLYRILPFLRYFLEVESCHTSLYHTKSKVGSTSYSPPYSHSSCGSGQSLPVLLETSSMTSSRESSVPLQASPFIASNGLVKESPGVRSNLRNRKHLLNNNS
jgi:hypothetical protein